MPPRLEMWIRASLCAALLTVGCAQLLDHDEDYFQVGGGGMTGAGAGMATSQSSMSGGASMMSVGGSGSSTTVAAGGNGTGGAAATGGGGIGGVGGAGTVTYVASVAACLQGNGSPSSCETAPGAMWVDIPNWRSFIRFDLDGVIAGKTVTSATLQLTVGDFGGADSSSTGELYEVTPFTAADLLNGPPNQVGGALLGDQGTAAALITIDMPLPTSMVSANGSVYLGIYPVVANGVGYWNLNGPDPPRLVVDYQ